MSTPAFRSRYILALLLMFIAVTVRSGIGAHYPQDWILENGLVFILIVLFMVFRRRFLSIFSLTSWTVLFVFFCINAIGAHWTYSEVPYREWWASITGAPLPHDGVWPGRNHFDRMVHFLYGLLFLAPIREFMTAVSPIKRGFWSHFVPLNLIMSTSMVYELIEWAAAEVFGSELGLAYNGSQGDIWDAQKDMMLATLGALIATLVLWRIEKRKSLTAAKPLISTHQDA
ncbi:putative membrane protein [Ereboglobus sp. PH5-10]|uniref:DUF2238 domain-containing protein n=1 Tax=Ereboglobus sp. PH5-10 TaxID=2940629 RepID=UPI0024057D05|nr:DUF2238 domain-containing protein [Ereboglobus sp. PH5-10]MDF9826892.1 putative membrane protein [Ereboglobus sp. PH5-10]